MFRILPLSLVLVLALAAVQPPAAAGSSQAEIERMAAQFEVLFQPMIGAIEARDLVFRDLGNGFRSLSYPLASAQIRSRSGGDTPFRTLACGHMAAEPTTPTAMVNAVIADLETQYNLWWALVNMGEEELLRRTAVRVVGPGGPVLAASEEVPYGPSAVHLIWFNPEMPFAEAGIYIHRVTVKGGGKAIYRFVAEEPPVTPPNP